MSYIFPEDISQGDEYSASDFNKLKTGAGFKILTAGETIAGATLPVPTFITRTSTAVEMTTDNDTPVSLGYNSDNDYYAQSFTVGPNITTITGITFKMYKHNSPTGNMNLGIYAASGDNPTGAALATGTYDTATLGGSPGAEITITLGTPLAVSPSTKYVWRLDYVAGTTTNYIVGKGASGGGVLVRSADGTNWNAVNKTAYYKIIQTALTNNVVYSSDANDSNRLKFHGFAISNSTDGNDITIQMGGIVSGFTGLSEGTKYYVQDDGTIGTSVGTTTILVGVAISATEIVIEKDSDYV